MRCFLDLLCLSCLLGMLSSCSIYKRDFDCPPKEGIPCTPVTILEKMIVESSCGEDAFTGCVPKQVEIQNKSSCKKGLPTVESRTPFQRRIWIASKTGRSGYIYFSEDIPCEEE